MLIVLKDLWGLEFEAAKDVVTWASRALIEAAVSDAAGAATAQSNVSEEANAKHVGLT